MQQNGHVTKTVVRCAPFRKNVQGARSCHGGCSNTSARCGGLCRLLREPVCSPRHLSSGQHPSRGERRRAELSHLQTKEGGLVSLGNCLADQQGSTHRRLLQQVERKDLSCSPKDW